MARGPPFQAGEVTARVESRPTDLHGTACYCTTPRCTYAAAPQHTRPPRPSASTTGMANNVMRWTTQTSGTVDVAVASDAAGNISVPLNLSGLPHSPRTVLHQNAHALRL